MASATRKATAAMKAALPTTGADLALGEDLLSAGRAIGGSTQLLAQLADPATDGATKQSLLTAVFSGAISDASVRLLASIVDNAWSSEADLLAGIEEAGIRVIAASAPQTDIEGEIFSIGRVITSNSELELNVGSKLVPGEAKAQLIQSLFADSVSEQTLAIVRHLVRQPRSRRINNLVDDATRIVADQRGNILATVTGVVALSDDQKARLERELAARTGRTVKLNHVVDPSLIGGVRVRLGDESIDGSVATRIADLRQQLVG